MIRNRFVAEDVQAITAAPLPFEQLAGKVVLVSGANGFVPAYLVEALVYLNDIAHAAPLKVIALVRNATRAHRRFTAYQGRPDLVFQVQDVCDHFTAEGPVDVVIHAASQASPKYFGRDPVGTLAANVFGTRNLLDLAREKNSQAFLFFSSAEVYGRVASDQQPVDEMTFGAIDPLDVRSCYAESKRLGETLCAAYRQQHGVPVHVVRLFHTYGPGMDLDDGRVFSDFVADVVRNRDIVLRSDGRAVRAFCYLVDTISAVFTVLLRGETGQVYNVGNMRATASVRQLAELLAGLFPERKLHVQHTAEPSTSSYLASSVDRVIPNTAKLEALGWRPRYSLEEGFRRTIRSFQCA